MLARIRRKRFEAKLLASELAGMWGGGWAAASEAAPPPTSRRSDHIHADQMLRDMKITIH